MIILGLVSNEVLVLLCMRLPNQNYLVLLPNERNYLVFVAKWNYLVSATKCTLIPNEKYLIIIWNEKYLDIVAKWNKKYLACLPNESFDNSCFMQMIKSEKLFKI